jgi:hypothetical protein
MRSSVPAADWNPGFSEEITLQAAYDAMPGDEPAAIPWYVRLLENPASPVAWPGAVDLFGHDCIHIVLGRGMLSQDEAFVVGYTMGASGKLGRRRRAMFTVLARSLYRGPYRFCAADQVVFGLAADFAAQSGARPVHDAAWHDMLDWPVGQVRAFLKIDVSRLVDVYQQERALCPRAKATMRLPRRDGHGRAAPGTGRP